MRVLYLSSRFPWPPHRGDRLTGYQMLRALSRRHEVTLASFVETPGPAEGASEIGALCRRIECVPLSRAASWRQAFLGLPLGVPSQVSYYRSAAMRETVARLVREERPDAIFVQLFRMAPFVESLDHPCKVLFLADSLALSLQRSLPYQPPVRALGLRWERRRVAAYEPAISRAFRESWVLSDVDARDLESRGARRIAVVPHGVDERLFDRELKAPAGERAVFLGNLSVPHNVDAAQYLVREVWPLVRRERPNAMLEIVGADPVPAVLALSSAAGVQVTGAVPSLLPVWDRAAVTVAPLRYSAGIQNKLLEPMAAGVPVVTTPQAAEALGAVDGRELRTGADPDALARATLDSLAEGEGALPMLRAARELVRTRFSWETLVGRLERLAATSA